MAMHAARRAMANARAMCGARARTALASMASSSSTHGCGARRGEDDDGADGTTPRRRPRSVREALSHVGATEDDIDVVVRVVWPGPIMKWPRPYDITEEEVATGDGAAARAARAWASARGASSTS